MPRRLSQQEEQALAARLQADPGFQAVANASYPSPMLRDQAIQNYLSNDPRSPLAGINLGGPSRGNGSYRFNPETGQMQFVSTSPSSYWTDPGGIGRDAVLAGVTYGALSGAGPSASAANAATGANGVPSMPWTLTAGSYGAAAPTGVNVSRAGLFSTLGRFFGSPGGAQITDLAGGLAGNWLQNRSNNRAADIAGQYNTQALDFLKDQDARDFAEYLREREREWGIEDTDRTRRYGNEDVDRARAEEMRQLGLMREREREGRLAPFRQGAARGYQTLSSLLFNPNQQMARAAPVQRRQLADLLR